MGHPLAVGAPHRCGSKGTQPLPRCEPRGTPAPGLCSTSSHHIYMLPAGRREEDRLEKWLKGTTGECRMLRNRGNIRLPSPRRAFHICSHCSCNLMTSATGAIQLSAVKTLLFSPQQECSQVLQGPLLPPFFLKATDRREISIEKLKPVQM